MTPRRRVGLLDINVLVALFDPAHVHHETAHDWFADNREAGWATCPLTENGFLRTAGRIARAREPIPVRALVRSLRAFTDSGNHEFWPDDVTLLNETLFTPASARGHQQLTDIYLLGLAVQHRGMLVTFDQKMDRYPGVERVEP